MNYQLLGRTGMNVSEVGLGCEYLEGRDYATVLETLDAAADAGINLIDVFMSEPQVRSNIGKAITGRREQFYIQGHLRAVWKNGQYGRTLDIGETKQFFDDLLARLGTDYLDIGMLHMIDNEQDYNAVFGGEILAYARELKEKGVLRSIGVSSHDPVIALKAVNSGLIDVLMFSVNPAYDLLSEHAELPGLSNDFFDQVTVSGMHPAREELYRTCAAKGVGITVMKSLAAGALLDSQKSPFGAAMSVPQCIHYALSRPAVCSVLVGMQSREQIAEAARTCSLADEDKDYATILSSKPKFSLKGRCMYCNHCLPCPSSINIAQVNKYLDLAEMSGVAPASLNEHYRALGAVAGDCVKCGSCESSCPFEVPVIARMERAESLFGA